MLTGFSPSGQTWSQMEMQMQDFVFNAGNHLGFNNNTWNICCVFNAATNLRSVGSETTVIHLNQVKSNYLALK